MSSPTAYLNDFPYFQYSLCVTFNLIFHWALYILKTNWSSLPEPLNEFPILLLITILVKFNLICACASTVTTIRYGPYKLLFNILEIFFSTFVFNVLPKSITSFECWRFLSYLSRGKVVNCFPGFSVHFGDVPGGEIRRLWNNLFYPTSDLVLLFMSSWNFQCLWPSDCAVLLPVRNRGQMLRKYRKFSRHKITMGMEYKSSGDSLPQSSVMLQTMVWYRILGEQRHRTPGHK